MNFFPVGPLIRRTGVFFIRRSFKDNELYKFVLRSYLDYLVENQVPARVVHGRGPFAFGKAAATSLRLLSYVVDSWRRNKAEDVLLVPISIAYDQIQDLGVVHVGGGRRGEGEGVVGLGPVRDPFAAAAIRQHSCPLRRTDLGGQGDGRK